MLMTSTANAANEIYIEQVGSTATIDITQQGNGNFVGTDANPVVITGSSNDIDIVQIGDNNLFNMEISGSSNQLSTTTTGDTNTLDIYCDTCSGNELNLITTGDNNSFVIGTSLEPVTFSDSTITSTIIGSYNETNLIPVLHSNIEQTITGNQNLTNLTHDGGLIGHNSIISVSGNNNEINAIQSGSETTLNLSLTGNDSVVNVSVTQ